MNFNPVIVDLSHFDDVQDWDAVKQFGILGVINKAIPRKKFDDGIFVTLPLNGTVAVLAPDGSLVREIPLRGKESTNLTFGGPEGKAVFVTQRDGRFVEAFRSTSTDVSPKILSCPTRRACSAPITRTRSRPAPI